MGLRIALLGCLFQGLVSFTAFAENPPKAPSPEEPLYQILVSVERRCEAKVQLENLKTGWKRDYFLNATQLDAAVDWSRGVGQVTDKTVVLIDYGRDVGVAFRGGARATLYATLMTRLARGRMGMVGKWRFFWVSLTAGAALEVANARIFGDPENGEEEQRIREGFRKFELLEEDVPTALRAIRSRMPERTADVRDGACEEFSFPAKIAGKDYVSMLSLGMTLGIEHGSK